MSEELHTYGAPPTQEEKNTITIRVLENLIESLKTNCQVEWLRTDAGGVETTQPGDKLVTYKPTGEFTLTVKYRKHAP